MISIIFPTRYKINELEITLNSIIDNASDEANYEIILGVDNDDSETINFLNTFILNKNNIKVVFFERLFYKNLHLYFNKLSEMSNGNLLWCLSDDCKILSKDWDIYLKKYENEFNYVKVNLLESNWDSHFSLIPIIPKKWFDLTGRISDYSQTDGWLSGVAINLNISKYEENVLVSNFVSANSALHSTTYTNSEGISYHSAALSPDLEKDYMVIKKYLTEKK